MISEPCTRCAPSGAAFQVFGFLPRESRLNAGPEGSESALAIHDPEDQTAGGSPKRRMPEEKKSKAAVPPDSDAPQQLSVRECSDRVAAMERELEELRARFAKVTERRPSLGA